MNAELRKRLEEAAEKQLNCATCLARKYGECKESKCLPYRSFLTGVEQGYKEAIALAKEWIEKYDLDWGEPDSEAFDKAMSKLWEGSI